MWKQEFLGRTEAESFKFTANPMHLRQVAAVILAQHGASFIEISNKNGNVLLVATYADNREPAFQFFFPDDETETNNE